MAAGKHRRNPSREGVNMSRRSIEMSLSDYKVSLAAVSPKFTASWTSTVRGPTFGAT